MPILTHRHTPLWITATAISLYLISLYPLALWTQTMPATGQDLSVHFLSLRALDAAPALRLWSPANFAGEAMLVHYFPLPFYLMELLATALPLGMSFNWITALPLFLFPFCAAYSLCAYRVGPAAGAGALVFSLIHLLNEKYSNWGGNATSTLMGQFTHLWALDFFLLAAGAFASDFRGRRWPWASVITICGVTLSHGSVFLGLPGLALAFIFYFTEGTWANRARHVLLAAGTAAGMCLWWLYPAVDTSAWNFPAGLAWSAYLPNSTLMPAIFWAMLALLVGTGILFARRRPPVLAQPEREYLFFLVTWGVGYALLMPLLPRLGLYDVRALPQVHLALALATGVLIGNALQTLARRRVAYALAAAAVAGVLMFTLSGARTVRSMASQSYASWANKSSFTDFSKLAENLRGSFADPRLLAESNFDYQSSLGSAHAMAMLPHFTNRAVLDGIYTQSNLLSFEVQHLKTLVSQEPFCTMVGACSTPPDLARAALRMADFAARDLVLYTPQTKQLALASGLFDAVGSFGPWAHFRLKADVSYVEVLDFRPKIEERDSDFLSTLKNSAISGRPIGRSILSNTLSRRAMERVQAANSLPPLSAPCRADARANYDGIKLVTECPNRIHLLKYAYYESFRADSGDDLFLMRPGFIGIVPSRNVTQIRFGQKISWRVSAWISLLALLAFAVGAFVVRRRFSVAAAEGRQDLS